MIGQGGPLLEAPTFPDPTTVSFHSAPDIQQVLYFSRFQIQVAGGRCEQRSRSDRKHACVGTYPAGPRQRRRFVGSARRGCWVYAAAGAAERRGAARGIGVGALQPDPVLGLVAHGHAPYDWKTSRATMEGQ